MTINVEMPVKPYLKRYVFWKENIEDDDILKLNSDSSIRMVLDALLTGKMTLYDSNKGKKTTKEIYVERIKCAVTPHTAGRDLIFIGRAHISWFNKYLYKELHDDLLYMILLHKEYGINESDTIYSFMESLGIQDMISFDALKKASYRVRKSRNLPVFSLRISRSAPNPYQFKVSGESV